MLCFNKDIRIRKLDKCNLVIEVLKQKINPKTKETADKWEIYGYYGGLPAVLRGLLKKLEFELIDNQIQDVETILSKIDEVEKHILEEFIIKEKENKKGEVK